MRDLDFEGWVRKSSSLGHVFVGWQDVELFALPPRLRSECFVTVVDWWRADVHLSRNLVVPTPAVYRYFSYMAFRSDSDKELLTIFATSATSDFVVCTLLFFLSALRDGVWWLNTLDPRLRHDEQTFLVPLHARLQRYIHESFGIFSIVRETGFDPVKSSLAYQLTSDVDWAGFHFPPHFIQYIWETGKVYNLEPVMAKPTKCPSRSEGQI